MSMMPTASCTKEVIVHPMPANSSGEIGMIRCNSNASKRNSILKALAASSANQATSSTSKIEKNHVNHTAHPSIILLYILMAKHALHGEVDCFLLLRLLVPWACSTAFCTQEHGRKLLGAIPYNTMQHPPQRNIKKEGTRQRGTGWARQLG